MRITFLEGGEHERSERSLHEPSLAPGTEGCREVASSGSALCAAMNHTANRMGRCCAVASQVSSGETRGVALRFGPFHVVLAVHSFGAASQRRLAPWIRKKSMNAWNSWLLLLVVGSLTPGCVGDCKESGSPEGQPLGFMAQYAADVCLAPVGGPGVTVTISTEDMTLGLGAAGELADGTPADVTSLFRLGELSEIYTAALVSRLVDEGRMDLADPISSYLDWVVTDDPISLRQLLAHRSGLKDARKVGSIDLSSEQGPEAIARAAVDAGPRFSPGEMHSLSSTDYLLLGLAVESELSQDFGLALHQRVLDPFGLGATFVDGYDELPEELAQGHNGAGRERTDAFDAANGGGALSIVSNGTDVERLLRLIFEDETFLAEVTRLEFAFPADGVAGESGFGFGVLIDTVAGDTAWSRAGDHPGGYGAAFVYLPDLRVASIALTNASPSNPGAIAALAAGYGVGFQALRSAE